MKRGQIRNSVYLSIQRKTLIHLNVSLLKSDLKIFPPRNLPAKSVEEALRHRQEYDEMVAEAKKRGIKFNSSW